MNKMHQLNNSIVIYQSKNGSIQLDVQVEKDTVWLNQAQMAELFGRDQSVLSRHIGNVFKEGELDRKSNMQNLHIANSDKPITLYNLDVVISVGYRAKSLEGTYFRQWATQVLHEHITQGYTINRTRIKSNYQSFLAAVDNIKKLLPDSKTAEISNENSLMATNAVVPMPLFGFCNKPNC
jgi:hypothetical protein